MPDGTGVATFFGVDAVDDAVDVNVATSNALAFKQFRFFFEGLFFATFDDFGCLPRFFAVVNVTYAPVVDVVPEQLTGGKETLFAVEAVPKFVVLRSFIIDSG